MVHMVMNGAYGTIGKNNRVTYYCISDKIFLDTDSNYYKTRPTHS